MIMSTSTSFSMLLVPFFTNEVECRKEVKKRVMNSNIVKKNFMSFSIERVIDFHFMLCYTVTGCLSLSVSLWVIPGSQYFNFIVYIFCTYTVVDESR